MDRIQDPTATEDNQFQEAGTGTVATRLRALWLNGIQEELIHILEEAGITPSSATLTQVLQALKIIFPTKAQLSASDGSDYIGYGSGTLTEALVGIAGDISTLEGEISSGLTGGAPVYADTTAGLAATSEGKYFNVPSATEGELLILYKHAAGPTATEIGRTPSSSVIAALELEVDGSVLSATIGTSEPTATELSAGTWAPVDTQPVRAGLDSVSFFLKAAGTYEIHAFRQVTDTTWEVIDVWPGSSAGTGLVTLEPGGGVIPSNHVLEEGDFIGISTGTARIAYGPGTEFVEVSGDSGQGSIVTRTLTSNGFDISIAYDYTAVTKGLIAKVSDAEASIATAQSDIAGIKETDYRSTVLVPPFSPVPNGFTDTGVTLMGLRVAVSNRVEPDVIAEVFSINDGFAAMPALSDMYQDSQQTVPAIAADDPVRSIIDVAPTPVEISAPSFPSSPLLKYDGSAHYLSFDGVNDRMGIPVDALNGDSFIFVCSVALRSGGNLPQIIGDTSTTTGVYFGFNNSGNPTFLASGIGSLIAPNPVTVGERTTLAFSYDGSFRRIYVNGQEVISVATSGALTLGSSPLLCYSGAPGNGTKSPIDLYGAVFLGTSDPDSARPVLEAVVSEGGYASSPTIFESEIDAAKKAMMVEFGEYFGLLSPEGTKVYAMGDSTIAAYAGGTAIMDLISSQRTEIDLSDPGDTIAQQKALWVGQTITESEVGWVVMQIGLNDLDPAEAASAAIARLQDLADTIKAGIGGRVLLIGQMVPCRQRMINIHGPVDGETAYQKWLDMNEAIAGAGATPITGVDGRITAHVPLMNDGSGNLKAEYDTGDGIHPNTAGRQVIADAWEAAINAAGMTV